MPTPHLHQIPILMYHSIATPARHTPYKCLHLPYKRFAWQMACLKRLGYTGLSMAELYPYLVGKKTGKVVGITFDDGYHNNLAVLPILQRYRFTATNFIVSDYIGDYNRWDIPKNIPKNRLMS